MRKATEFLLFGVLAVGLHIAAFADLPDHGADAGGSQGDALVSLTGATEQVETMVATWTRPPSTQTAPQSVQTMTVPTQTSLPNLALKIEDAPNADLKVAALTIPDTPAPPVPDTATAVPQPTPPPQAAPLPRIKPKKRPQKAKASPPKPAAKPDTKARKASSGASAQKAAGSGGGTQAGTSGRAKTASLSKSKEASLIATWGSRIRTRIERRKRFPKGARAKGRVILKVAISRSGQLQGVSVRRSSGHAALDAAAVKAVRQAGKFPPAPKQLTRAVYQFSLPVDFSR